MYRILIFVNFTWTEWAIPVGVGTYRLDCLEDAMAALRGIEDTPWRVQEWIDIRNGPAEAGFWHDVAYWIDGREYRSTTERMT